jgi:hypothetical protein
MRQNRRGQHRIEFGPNDLIGKNVGPAVNNIPQTLRLLKQIDPELRKRTPGSGSEAHGPDPPHITLGPFCESNPNTPLSLSHPWPDADPQAKPTRAKQ